ncbi:unnamed protein product [Lactuca saligna]|uniref:Uncharacterized protein n=1 Tax=Lactuca saligna TaxID=75948 RepID=A0AA35ZMK8_LACSI|nr:unnamed protein product [Lactuca saligna]
MLKRVDPTNAVLIEYLTTIDPKVETEKLLTKEDGGPSKKSRTTKKIEIITPEPNVQETKKSKSPKNTMKQDEQVSQVVLKYGGSPISSVVRKPHVTHQGVIMREVPAHVYPLSKKRRVEDMAKQISKKKKRQLVFPTHKQIGGGGEFSLYFEIDGLMKAFEAQMVSKISGMIKDTESKILEKVDQSDHTTELRINSFNSKYVGAVKEFTNVQKERHTLFVMDVKKVREDAKLKLQELHDDMVKEFVAVQHDYATLHKKVDIICDAVMKYVKLYEILSPQITQLSTTDNQQFGELISMLKDLKESMLKPASSLIITPKFLSLKFSQFEAIGSVIYHFESSANRCPTCSNKGERRKEKSWRSFSCEGWR